MKLRKKMWMKWSIWTTWFLSLRVITVTNFNSPAEIEIYITHQKWLWRKAMHDGPNGPLSIVHTRLFRLSKMITSLNLLITICEKQVLVNFPFLGFRVVLWSRVGRAVSKPLSHLNSFLISEKFPFYANWPCQFGPRTANQTNVVKTLEI